MKKHITVDLINHIVSVKVFATGMVLLFLACNGHKKTTLKNGEESDALLQLILNDDHSGAEISETLVITDYKTLESFYSQINMTRKPGLPVPEIDFKKEMIVITCSGERNDGSIPELAIMKETDSQLVLSVSLQSATEKYAGAITSPFSVYKMPLTDKKIIFEEINQ